jgi:opacity protein-like surface antigen
MQRALRIAVILAALAAFAFAADFTGTWTVTFETQVGQQPYTFVFKQDGAKLTGKASNAFAKAETEITEGTVTGDDIAFVENLNYEGMPLRISYKGKLTGGDLKLTRNVMDFGTEEGVAKKSAPATPATKGKAK